MGLILATLVSEGSHYMTSVDLTQSNQRRTTLTAFLVLLISAVILTFGMVLPYLIAVVMGAILALLSQPFYRGLIAKGVKPGHSALLITLAILLILIVPVLLFAMKAVQQGIAIGHNVAQGGISFESLWDKIKELGPVTSFIESPEAFESQAREWLQRGGAILTATVLGIAGALPNIILQLALALFTCYFLLLDGKKFMKWMKDKIPLDSDVRAKVAASFKDTAISSIWATLAAAGGQAVLMLVAYLALGVPAAFLAAGATFIFAWIPMVGSAPVWLAGAIYLYTQGSIVKVIIMVILGIVTGIIDNFIRPLVLKGRSNMHPLVSLVAIFGGIGMFGIMGIFVGPIIAAIMIALLQIWPDIGRRFGLFPTHHSEALLPGAGAGTPEIILK